MKIAIGGDHSTIIMKKAIVDMLEQEGHEMTDFGAYTSEPTDYPDHGQMVAEKVASGEFDYGIVICGTGIGISISANKVKGIRCALCSDVFSAKATRLHNNTNMLALGVRNTGLGVALEIAKAWVETPFSGDERHVRRNDKVTAIENKYFK